MRAASPVRWKVHSTRACSERGSHSRKALPPSTPNTFRSSNVGWDESGEGKGLSDSGRAGHAVASSKATKSGQAGALTPGAQRTRVAVLHVLPPKPPAGSGARGTSVSSSSFSQPGASKDSGGPPPTRPTF